MSIPLIAGAIIFLVICSLVISSISYNRQKAIAQQRKEIAQYKSKIEELTTHKNFLLNIDPDYEILLLVQKQLLAALGQILERVPNDSHVQKYTKMESENLQQLLQRQRPTEINQIMSSDEELSQAKRSLAGITKHLDLSRNAGALSPAIHQNLTTHLKNLGLLIEVESHEHQAQLFAEQGDVVLYQAHIKQARDALRKAPIDNDNKNLRIRQLTETLKESKRTNKIVSMPNDTQRETDTAVELPPHAT